MKNDFINSLIGQNAASNVIFGKKKPDVQPTITANPSAVSPIATDTSKIAQFSQGLAQRTNSPAKDAYVKSQMATAPQGTTLGNNTATQTNVIAPDASSNKFNTATGLSNPNYVDPNQPATPAPTTTPEAPKAPSKYEDAMTAYIQSLTQTPEEKALRADIAKRSGQSAIDYEKALQSGETMGFASGEASRVERQNQLGIGAQTGALTALTAGREGDVAANKARVDYLSTLETTPKQQLELKKAQAELDKTLAETKKTTAETGQVGAVKPMTAYEQAKFNQDAAQFGKTYALQARETALKEAAAAPTAGTGDQAINQVNLIKTSIENAKKLADSSGNTGILGRTGRFLAGSDDYTNLVAETNTLRTNLLTLATDPSIKKFFGPQMSNADVQLMTSAGTTLNPELQSPENLKKEITRIEGLMNKLAAVKGVSGTAGTNVIAPDGTNVILTD